MHIQYICLHICCLCTNIHVYSICIYVQCIYCMQSLRESRLEVLFRERFEDNIVVLAVGSGAMLLGFHAWAPAMRDLYVTYCMSERYVCMFECM